LSARQHQRVEFGRHGVRNGHRAHDPDLAHTTPQPAATISAMVISAWRRWGSAPSRRSSAKAASATPSIAAISACHCQREGSANHAATPPQSPQRPGARAWPACPRNFSTTKAKLARLARVGLGACCVAAPGG
jgi:hypothetical protein